MAQQKIGTDQTKTVRRMYGTTINAPKKREIGSVKVLYAGNSAAYSMNVIFETPFDTVPHVTVSFGGDNANSSITDSTAGNLVEGRMLVKATNVTDSQFTIWIHTGGGGNFGGGGNSYCIVRYTAEG